MNTVLDRYPIALSIATTNQYTVILTDHHYFYNETLLLLMEWSLTVAHTQDKRVH